MGGPGSGRKKGSINKKNSVKYTPTINRHKKSFKGGSRVQIRDYKTGGFKNY